jgi:hypothetical protein
VDTAEDGGAESDYSSVFDEPPNPKRRKKGRNSDPADKNKDKDTSKKVDTISSSSIRVV